MHPHAPAADLVLTLATAVLHFLDQAHPLVLAAVAYATAQLATNFRPTITDVRPARIIAAIFMVAYAAHWHRAVDFQDEIGASLIVLLRIIAAGVLFFYIVALPFVSANHAVRRQLNGLWRGHQKRWEERRDARRSRREQRQAERARRDAPPPPTREELVQARGRAARKDYDADVKVIEASALEGSERRRALNFAKQKYLRRLSNSLE
jgi:hypothetical protein